jgi:hypothetical protein
MLKRLKMTMKRKLPEFRSTPFLSLDDLKTYVTSISSKATVSERDGLITVEMNDERLTASELFYIHAQLFDNAPFNLYVILKNGKANVESARTIELPNS